jgi:hypothetical protein
MWKNYSEKRFGAPRIMAIALADEADDKGRGIVQAAATLAEKTEQTLRAVRMQLKRLQDSGLLVLVEKSPGGPGQVNHYRIDIAVLIGLDNGEPGSPLTVNAVHRLTPPNGEPGSPLAEPLYKELKEENVEGASSFTVSKDVSEDRRLAHWMFDRLLALNPQHRVPNWPAWCKHIRLMRERDARSRHDIAELFAFANADPFWQANVLCPGTLRKQWDRLVLKRRSNGGTGAQAAPPPPSESGCTHEIEGQRCGKPAAFWDREGRGLCRQCREDVERACVRRAA